ncbi:MAG: helix-turn-helix transcriptional regulator [Ruminococcaceae bacterium]|nr:helix-turn-helix transcriptional regulator [Oscillospiraceae bacterium]
MEKGSGKIVSEEITIEIHENGIFYIPKGLSYQSYWYGDKIQFKSLGFHFFAEAKRKNFVLQKVDCDEQTKNNIKDIPTLAQKGNTLFPTVTNSSLYGDFYSVVSEIEPLLCYRDVHRKKSLFEKAKKYIYENNGCSVSDIAKYCMMSESAIYELFKKEGNITPNTQKQLALCEKAVLMLNTTDKSIQEISDSLGFSSTSYFRKILWKHHQKTPSQIRKESRLL